MTDKAWPSDAAFQLGEAVQKKGRASWRGHVVGWYRTSITALGYAVESAFEPGSVQIYPESALEAWAEASAPNAERDKERDAAVAWLRERAEIYRSEYAVSVDPVVRNIADAIATNQHRSADHGN